MQAVCLTCNAERLHQSPLFKCQAIWQLEAEISWMIHILAQSAMHWWQREKLDVGVQVVPTFPTHLMFNCISVLLWMCIASFMNAN